MVVPPIRDFYLTPHRLSALGAKIVADLCQRAGHKVTLFLFPLEGKAHVLPLPPEASHLLAYIVPGEFGPLSFFTRFQHFGPPFEICAHRILATRPDAILISCFAFAYAEEAVALAQALKMMDPDVVIAVGGAGPSACPEYFLGQEARSNPNSPADYLFDFVVGGEGEVTIPLLLEQLEQRTVGGGRAQGSGRKGIATGVEPQWIPADRLCREQELSAPIAVLKETADEIWAATSLSRGCPRRCMFCSNHLCHGRQFRVASLGSLEQALKKLPPRRGLHLNFEDDNLLHAAGYFFEALGLVKSSWPQVEFTAENGLDYHLLDPITIDRLIQYGFRRFNLSVGTIHPETASQVSRPVDLSHYKEVVREIHNRGATSVTYFIAGLAKDTPEGIVHQIQYLHRLPTLIGISLFYPVPGLPGFTPPPPLMTQNPGVARGSFAYPWTGSLTTGEMITAFRLCRYVNLLKKAKKTLQEEELIERIREQGRLQTFQKQVASPQSGKNHLPNRWAFREVPGDEKMVKLFFSH